MWNLLHSIFHIEDIFKAVIPGVDSRQFLRHNFLVPPSQTCTEIDAIMARTNIGPNDRSRLVSLTKNSNVQNWPMSNSPLNPNALWSIDCKSFDFNILEHAEGVQTETKQFGKCIPLNSGELQRTSRAPSQPSKIANGSRIQKPFQVKRIQPPIHSQRIGKFDRGCRGIAALLIALPAYRWFFLISVLIGLVIAGGLTLWQNLHPIKEHDVETKRPLGL